MIKERVKKVTPRKIAIAEIIKTKSLISLPRVVS